MLSSFFDYTVDLVVAHHTNSLMSVDTLDPNNLSLCTHYTYQKAPVELPKLQWYLLPYINQSS